MPFNRRHILLSAATLSSGALSLKSNPVRAQDFELDPPSSADQTAALQAAIESAVAKHQVLHLPAGTFRCRTLGLPSGTRITGVPGATRILFTGSGAFLVASRAENLALDGLVIDGGGRPLDPQAADGLLTFSDCTALRLWGLTVMGSSMNGISLRRCSGEVSSCTVSACDATALFSLDAQGLSITANRIDNIGNNGIQVWRSEAGEDGTLVAQNHIGHIAARAGGDGPNGNGINVFRAASVRIVDNRMTDCAFSAIRANSASNCQMIGNSAERIGEVAIYAEFAFQGALIANNLVNHASTGISVTNFDRGGRLAVVQGNLLRNLRRLSASGEDQGIGIAVEADTSVTGNVIESAERIGIQVGWGSYRRDTVVTGNIVRACPIGIGLAAGDAGGAVLVAQNLISGATGGGIRQMDHMDPVGPDLARNAADAGQGISISGNVSA